MYPGWCQRQVTKNTVEVHTRERHAILEDPSAHQADAPKDIVVIHASLVRAEVIGACTHLN